MRNFQQEVSHLKCWDSDTEAFILENGHAPDILLQNSAELEAFCEWIEAHQIRSYLEIGIF